MYDGLDVWRRNIDLILPLLLIIKILLVSMILYEIHIFLREPRCAKVLKKWMGKWRDEVQRNLLHLSLIVIMFILIMFLEIQMAERMGTGVVEWVNLPTLFLDVVILVIWPVVIAMPKHYAICTSGLFVRGTFHPWAEIKAIARLPFKSSIVLKKKSGLYPDIVVPLPDDESYAIIKKLHARPKATKKKLPATALPHPRGQEKSGRVVKTTKVKKRGIKMGRGGEKVALTRYARTTRAEGEVVAEGGKDIRNGGESSAPTNIDEHEASEDDRGVEDGSKEAEGEAGYEGPDTAQPDNRNDLRAGDYTLMYEYVDGDEGKE